MHIVEIGVASSRSRDGDRTRHSGKLGFVLLCLTGVCSFGCSRPIPETQAPSAAQTGVAKPGKKDDGRLSILGIPFAVTLEELREALPEGTKIIPTTAPGNGARIAAIAPVPARDASTSTAGLSLVTAVFSSDTLKEDRLWRIVGTSRLGWDCEAGDLEALMDSTLSGLDEKFDKKHREIKGNQAVSIFVSQRKSLMASAICNDSEIAIDFGYVDVDSMKFKDESEALAGIAEVAKMMLAEQE